MQFESRVDITRATGKRSDQAVTGNGSIMDYHTLSEMILLFFPARPRRISDLA